MASNSQPAFIDDKYYNLKLGRPVEFPSGSRNFLSPVDVVHVLGKAAKTLDPSAILEAVEAAADVHLGLAGSPEHPENPPPPQTGRARVRTR